MYALIAHTRGDDLIHSTQQVVLTSRHRAKVERARTKRQRERTRWLAHHPLPWWAQANIIVCETIEKVEEV